MQFGFRSESKVTRKHLQYSIVRYIVTVHCVPVYIPEKRDSGTNSCPAQTTVQYIKSTVAEKFSATVIKQLSTFVVMNCSFRLVCDQFLRYSRVTQGFDCTVRPDGHQRTESHQSPQGTTVLYLH